MAGWRLFNNSLSYGKMAGRNLPEREPVNLVRPKGAATAG